MVAFGAKHGLTVFDLSAWNWGVLVLSSLIGIALGHVFFYAAMARLGVAVTTAVVQFAPFITGAASSVLFDEVLTALQWGSGVVLLCGGVMLLRAEQIRPRSAATPQRESPVVSPPKSSRRSMDAEASR